MQQLIHRNDTTAERLVLASLMLTPELFDTPEAVLPPEAFYNETNRKLYRAASRVHRDTGCADFHLVAEQAREDGMRDAALQVAALITDEHVMNSPTWCTAYFPAYAQKLRRAYVERERAKAALTYQQALKDGQDEHEARIILDATLDALDQMTPLETTDEEILHLLGSGARFPTGISRIDTLSGGLTRPGLNIIAAREATQGGHAGRNLVAGAPERGVPVGRQ